MGEAGRITRGRRENEFEGAESEGKRRAIKSKSGLQGITINQNFTGPVDGAEHRATIDKKERQIDNSKERERHDQKQDKASTIARIETGHDQYSKTDMQISPGEQHTRQNVCPQATASVGSRRSDAHRGQRNAAATGRTNNTVASSVSCDMVLVAMALAATGLVDVEST